MKRRILCTGSFALLVGLAGCSSSGGDGDGAVKAAPNASTGNEAAGAGSAAAAAGTTASPTAATDPLPAAFKGYELYAWDEGGEVAFTLITGTNRQKTVAEIAERGPDMAAGEFVAVRGQGLAELEDVLARVPPGTSVILAELAGLPPLGAEQRAAIEQLL